MSAVTLSDAVSPVRVESEEIVEESDAPALSLRPNTAVELRALNAPDDLVRDVAIASASPESDEALPIEERLTQFAEGLWGDEDELVSVETVHRRIRVLGCSAPGAAAAKVATTLGISATGEGGLELKVGSFGLKSSVKYALTQELKLDCGTGETKLGYLLVPFERQTWMRKPPGAAEKFRVERLVPIKDLTQFGAAAAKGEVGELLEGAIGEGTPLGGGDASFSGSRSRKLELSFTVELGFGDEVNKVGLSATVSGSVEVTAEISVPAGSFRLQWLTVPPGAIVTDVRSRS